MAFVQRIWGQMFLPLFLRRKPQHPPYLTSDDQLTKQLKKHASCHCQNRFFVHEVTQADLIRARLTEETPISAVIHAPPLNFFEF